MVFYCSAYNCKNSTKNKRLSFHTFPLNNPNLLKKWLNNLRWKDWTPLSHSKICSAHFEQKCITVEGRRIRLKKSAVPTIFTFSNPEQERKAKINPRSKRALGLVGNSNPVVTDETSSDTDSEKFDQSSSEKKPPWTILGDEALDRNMTLPSFFHGGYCLPKNICWAGDDELNIMPHVVYGVPGQTKPNIIEVKHKWEWLGLDIRGPFSPTVNQHTHIMTLTDYHSKWVEAFPVTKKLCKDVAEYLTDIIQQQGYPLGILSRLSKQTILEINRELKKHLSLANSLVIQHRQTGYVDLATESLLNEMLDELVKQHKGVWHVALPAATLRLCCTNHPTTGEKPFTRMCASDTPFSSLPRQLPYSATDVRLSSFVISSSTEASDPTTITETLVQLNEKSDSVVQIFEVVTS